MNLKLLLAFLIFIGVISGSKAQAPDLVIQKGHTRGITKISFNNEGNRIITLGNDLATKVWDPFNGRLISDLQSTTGTNGSTFYSPDNRFVLTMSVDNSMYGNYNQNFSDPLSGRLLHTLKVSKLQDFCISPNGKYFITKDYFNEFRIFDSYTGKLLRVVKAYSNKELQSPVSINFTNDSTLIVGCLKFLPNNKEGKLFYTLYNLISNKIISTFDDFDGGYDLTFSNTGRYMISQKVMPPDGDSRIFDLKENKIIWQKNFNLTNIVFSPDDRNFIATCTDVKGAIHKSPNPTVTIEFSTEDSSKYFIIPYINANHNRVIDYSKEAFHRYSPKGNFIAYGLKIEDNDDVSDLVVRVGIYNRKYELVSVCPSIGKPITALCFSNDENYIVAGYDDGSFITWDIRGHEGKKIAETELIFDPINEVHFDKKTNRLFYLTDDAFYKVDEKNFSTKKYAEFGRLPASNFKILENYSFLYLKKDFPPSNNLVVINNDSMTFKDNISTIKDFKELELDKSTHTKLSLISKPLQNAGGKRILVWDSLHKDLNDSIQILSIVKPKSTNNYLLKISKSLDDYFSYSYNKEVGYYVNLRIDSGIFLLDDKSFQYNKIEKRNEYLSKNRISNNGKYLFSNYSNGAKKSSLNNSMDSSFFYCYDIKSGKLAFRFLNDDPSCEDVLGIENPIFSPDNSTFCIFNKIINQIFLHETTSGKRILTLEGHASSIKGVEYSDDSKYLYSWSEDGTCKKWNVKTGELVYTLIQFKDHDYAYILPDGYYYISSRSDTKYLNFRWDNKLYSFGQFDLMFNRPDKVLQALGNKDSSLVNLYHKAWLERIKKTGFKESDFENTKQLQIPTTTLKLDSISTFTRNKNFQLSFSLSDSLFFLNSYTIYINDVPINGINGTKINPNTNTISIVKQLELSEGQNKIEVNCINNKGVESRKEAIYVNYKPTIEATSKVYFIGIGINRYNNNPSFKDLSYCVKDIENLTTEFSKKYNNITIDTLLNEKATKENIMALKQKLMQTNIEDKVIVSFSGHGMVDNTNNEFYFVTGKTNASNPSKDGVSYSDLEDLLDSIPARKKLMLLDACHSGESEDAVESNETVSKEGSRGNTGGTDDLNKDNKGDVQLIDILQDEPKNVVTATSVFKLMKEAFVDIRRNNGAYVISASQSNESALENNQVSNGIFTHAILDILQQYPTISVNELNILANKKVTELTHGNQNTANRQELSDFNWKLW